MVGKWIEEDNGVQNPGADQDREKEDSLAFIVEKKDTLRKIVGFGRESKRSKNQPTQTKGQPT